MKTIQISSIEKHLLADEVFTECTLSSPINENTGKLNLSEYYMEAVFNNGREKLKPILEAVVKVKELLDEKIKEQQDTAEGHAKNRRIKISRFNPHSFWKSNAIKEWEDRVKEVFGFRSVIIEPTIEKYSHKIDDFNDPYINACVYSEIRYPVEGIVSDNGFYDKTHSCYFTMVISLGLIRLLEPEEIVAILIHEIGHKIDPAIMDVKYTETNILAKTLTDRKGKYTPSENQYLEKHKKKSFGLPEICIIFFGLVAVFDIVKGIWSWIYRTFINKEQWRKDRVEKLRKMIKKEDQFRRQIYDEAFADNIARMYGYGKELGKALTKMGGHYNDYTKKYFKREFTRESHIVWMTTMALKDEHKTEVHRIHALIKEYEEDIKDTTIPKKVRDNLEADKKELEIILDKYLNSFDEFSNSVNKMIAESLKEIDEKAEEKKAKEEKK